MTSEFSAVDLTYHEFMSLLHGSVAVVMPVAVGGGFLAAARLTVGSGDDFVVVLGTVFSIIMAAVFAACALAGLGLPSARSILHASFTPVLFLASSFGFLLVVETTQARYGLTILAMVLLGIYFDELGRVAFAGGRRNSIVLDRFSYLLDVISVFFIFSFAFGYNSFIHVPAVIAATAIGIIVGLACFDVCARTADARTSAVFGAAIGLAGAELYVAFVMMPTAWLVNAAVVGLLFFAAVQARPVGPAIRVPAAPIVSHRAFAASIILAALVLATAQWA